MKFFPRLLATCQWLDRSHPKQLNSPLVSLQRHGLLAKPQGTTICHIQVVAIRRVDVIDNTPAGVDVSAGGVAAPPTIRWIVPEKYSVPSSSGLSAEVKSGSPNDFPFDLK
jgi:hypothetical protein